MRSFYLLLLVGCGGDDTPTTPDANTSTPPSVAMLCTSGNPGDPTCPLNNVELGNGSRLEFALFVDAQVFDVTDAKLTAGASGLYLAHPRFEAWPDGAAAPTPNPNDPNATTIINLVANGTTILTPTTVTSSRLVLAYDAIGPHR